MSKLRQSQNMQLDKAVDLPKQTEASLAVYKNKNGFAAAQTSAKEIKVEAALK